MPQDTPLKDIPAHVAVYFRQARPPLFLLFLVECIRDGPDFLVTSKSIASGVGLLGKKKDHATFHKFSVKLEKLRGNADKPYFTRFGRTRVDSVKGGIQTDQLVLLNIAALRKAIPNLANRVVRFLVR